MNCPNCGKPLKYLESLTDEEYKELIYINSNIMAVNTIFEKLNNLKDCKNYKFILNLVSKYKNKISKSENLFFDKIKYKYNVNDIYIEKGDIYIHE